MAGRTFGDTAPFKGCVAMADNVAVTGFAIRSVDVDCATTGQITLTFADGSSFSPHMQANSHYSWDGEITTFHVLSGTVNSVTAFY